MVERGDGGPRPVAVVVMAKVPAVGQVKTRLARELGDEAAAALYAAMLADRCHQVARLQGIVPAIAFAGHDTGAVDPALVPVGFEVVPQTLPGLGAGLEQASRHFLDRGAAVVLVDSDSPTLPQVHLEQAVERLRAGADVVLGPADDGGYCLIGLSAPRPELFEDVPWSTPEVTRVTLERARRAELDVHLLAPWWDVDDSADLERLRTTLLGQWWPSRTAAWLREQCRPAAPPVTGDAADHWRVPWRNLGGRDVYATRWLRLREDRVALPTGAESTYSVVDCGECVGVLPFVDRDTVLMVRQHRYIAGRVTWEMPTGGVKRGEPAIVAAHRELAEEAGVKAARLEPIGSYHTSKSVMDETAHLLLAYDLEPVAARADEDEFIRAEPCPFERVLSMVLSGEIVDSMTIIAVLRAERLRG